jgi:hypothetical protein
MASGSGGKTPNALSPPRLQDLLHEWLFLKDGECVRFFAGADEAGWDAE